MRPRRIKIASVEADRDEYDVDASPEDPTPRGRLRIHPLIVLLLVVVGAYALVAVGLNLIVDTDRVRGWVSPRASALLNRPVSTGDARIALLPRPSIHISDLRVDNLENFDGPALASVDRIRLDVRWLPLLTGHVDVHQIHVDGPRIYLGVDPTGTSNFGDLVPSAKATDETLQSPMSLGVVRLAVSGGSISFMDAPAARSLTVSGVDAEVSLAPSAVVGWRAEVVAESDSLLARVAAVTEEIVEIEGPRATLTVRSEGGSSPITLENGIVELSGETLVVNGRLSGLADARPSYALQLLNDSMDAGALTAVLPASVRSRWIPTMDGRVGVALELTGARSPGRRPVLRGSLRLADVGVVVSGERMVEGLTGTVAVTPDTILLDSLQGRFADGPFELSGNVDRATRIAVIETWARPNLGRLDRLGILPPGTSASGDAALDLALIGRLDALDSADVAGVVRLDGVQARHARSGVPFYVPAGELTLLDGEVTWTDLPVMIGEDQVVTTGRMRRPGRLGREDGTPAPELYATVSGPRLDLDAVLPAGDSTPAPTYTQIALAHLGERPIEGRPAAEVLGEMGLSRPMAPPFEGSVGVELDTLRFRRYALESVSGRLELSDTLLVVDVSSFELWGSPASGVLRLGLGDGPREPFSVELAANGVPAEELLGALTPAGDAITGALLAEVALSGTMDRALLPVEETLTGRVLLSISDGRVRGTGPNLAVADFLGDQEWADLPFASWTTDLAVVAGQLEVRGSELDSERGHVALRGLIDLDGSHDLSLGLSIPPERLGTVSLRRTGIAQSVLDHLSAAGSPLSVGLRMSGNLRAPQIEPDASIAVAVAR